VVIGTTILPYDYDGLYITIWKGVNFGAPEG
jgi:hypothetical protein